MTATGPSADRRGPALVDRALEGPRTWAAYARFAASAPALRIAPQGDGHPVLVLPGFLATDLSTVPLRRFLQRLGYRAHGWRLGRNLGPRTAVIDGLARSIAQIVRSHGQPLSLVGWSLGGVFARRLAIDAPEAIRQVISLGTPFNDLQGRLSPLASPDPLPVPSTAIYTRSDGIVPWQTTIQRPSARAENVEVRGSHCGLGVNRAALLAVADRLAQPDGTWAPFRPPPALRDWYPPPWPATATTTDRLDPQGPEQAWTA